MGWVEGWTSLEPLFLEVVIDAEAQRIPGQELRSMRETIQPEGYANRETPGLPGVPSATALQPVMREQQAGCDEGDVSVSRQEVQEGVLRIVRGTQETARSPLRPGLHQQQPGEPPDTVPVLSRLLAHYSETSWADGSWENATPRTVSGTAHRVDRLKAIGNGQVPQVAALAFRTLYRRIGGHQC